SPLGHKVLPLVLIKGYKKVELSKPPVSQPSPLEIRPMHESANEDDEPILSKPLVRYGLIWGIWTIVALFFSTQMYLMYYAENQPIRYGRNFLVQASACYLWALATPLILWLVRRYCIDRSNWLRRAALHLVISITLVITLIGLHFVIYMLVMGRAARLRPSAWRVTSTTTSIAGCWFTGSSS